MAEEQRTSLQAQVQAKQGDFEALRTEHQSLHAELRALERDAQGLEDDIRSRARDQQDLLLRQNCEREMELKLRYRAEEVSRLQAARAEKQQQQGFSAGGWLPRYLIIPNPVSRRTSRE